MSRDEENLDREFIRAAVHYRAGRLAEARALCESLLSRAPSHVFAKILSGAIDDRLQPPHFPAPPAVSPIASGLKVAVITPYYKEDEAILRQCHNSVAAQTYPCTHCMVADGFPHEAVGRWPVEHIVLPHAHGDNGDTPRSIGALSATSRGFNAIAFLDADNWLQPSHVQAMVALHLRTGAAVCTAGRTIHRLDGSPMYRDIHDCDGENLVDTSCIFLTGRALRLVALWGQMPRELAPLCDQVFWRAIKARKLPRAHSPAPTVEFRSQYAVHYQAVGETAPPNAKSKAEFARATEWWNGLPEDVRAGWIRFFEAGEI